jgi:outer membrane protein
VFDVNFEILQSARPMHSFRILGGLSLATVLVAMGQTNQPPTSLPPTAGVRTNAINLTATNFIAGGLSVSNGVMVGFSTNNVPPTSILGTNITVRPITLEETIALALRNNYDILIARYNPDIARFNLAGSYAVYEPAAQLGYEHSFRSSPGGFTREGLPLPSEKVYNDNFSGAVAPGLSGYLPTGTRYGASASINGRDPETGADIFTGNATLSLSQPLLRDFWIDQPRMTIMVNKKRVQISEWQLRQQLINTISAVESAYYDLIRARENIKVQRAALEYNNQLLRENKKRVEVGALAPLDEKQAEAEVARGVAALLQTEQVYALQLNNLKNLIVQDFPNWSSIVIDPVETLVAVPVHPELPESWKQGLTLRPELQQLKLDLESRDIELKFLKNQLWPALDVTGSYGHNSISPFGIEEGSYEKAVRRLASDDFRSHSIGVILSVPLGNRAARNSLKAARASKAQAILDYKALEQNIMVQIDNAIKLLQSQFQQVEATRQARLFAQDALAAEQKRYENGKSTSFNVLLFQRDLTRSRFEELAALAEYNKALAGLAAQEGTTLQRHNLNLTAE